MSKVYVVREQIYRNLETGAVAQIRQEMSDGSVQWQQVDGSVLDGPSHDPASKRVFVSIDEARRILGIGPGDDIIKALAEADKPRYAPFLKAEELGMDVLALGQSQGYKFELGPQYGPSSTI